MRLIAHFTPQAWVNDYAITCDAEGESRWDVTEHLRSLSPEQCRAEMESNSHASDLLRDLAHAPAWVRDWSGPYYVTVDAVAETDADHALLRAVDDDEVFDWEDAGRNDEGFRFRHRTSGQEIVAPLPAPAARAEAIAH